MPAGPTIAVIPARGGSRRIPNKNIHPLGGRPMLAWTVEAALESRCFAHVLVSTDSPEIAAIARAAGAAAPFLRQAQADDVTPVAAATLHALDQAEAHFGERFAHVAQLLPTCPLRRAGHIRAAMAAFSDSRADFQISATRYGWLMPWWAHRVTADGSATPLFPSEIRMRSQDLPPLYCPSGAIWIARRDALRAHGGFYGPGYRFWELDWRAAIDIDEPADLAMAETLLAASPAF